MNIVIKIKMENKLLYKDAGDGEEEMMPVMLKEREVDIENTKTSKRLRSIEQIEVVSDEDGVY